jgi:hypothetical protein
MTGPASRGWNTATVRLVIGLVSLAAVVVIIGGYALYEYVTQNYEIDGGKPNKGPVPAKGKSRR